MSSAGQHAVGSHAMVLVADECLHICIVRLVLFFLTDLVVARGCKWLMISPGIWEGPFTCQMGTRIIMRIYQLWLPESSRCPGIALFQGSMLSE